MHDVTETAKNLIVVRVARREWGLLGSGKATSLPALTPQAVLFSVVCCNFWSTSLERKVRLEDVLQARFGDAVAYFMQPRHRHRMGVKCDLRRESRFVTYACQSLSIILPFRKSGARCFNAGYCVQSGRGVEDGFCLQVMVREGYVRSRAAWRILVAGRVTRSARQAN